MVTDKKEPFSISISSTLRDWIENYVEEQAKKFPTDERYKNKSTFLNYVLEKTMNILRRGKTLEDLDNLPDSEVKDFFDDITFQAVTGMYENAVEMNKYIPIEFLKDPKLYLQYREILKGEVITIKDFENKIERIKKFLLSNKLTKDLKFYKSGGSTLMDYEGTVEYTGTFKNLHFENTKGIAVILGTVGLKVVNFLYSEGGLYSRFDFKSTPFFGKIDLHTDEVENLVDENLQFVLNYSRIVNDKDLYLWIKLAKYDEFFIGFYDEFLFEKLIEDVKEDFRYYLKNQDFHYKLLKFFENLHWINITNEQELIFSLNLSQEWNKKEIAFLNKILSKYGNLTNRGNNYVLEKKNQHY
ncbi:MAG: hypothetical protein P8Y70_14375 [Candidatus Lokiarchaeota archaeon]